MSNCAERINAERIINSVHTDNGCLHEEFSCLTRTVIVF